MSGSEGGGIETNRCFLPLYLLRLAARRPRSASRAGRRAVDHQRDGSSAARLGNGEGRITAVTVDAGGVAPASYGGSVVVRVTSAVWR
jgi:hypothetical protein